jgi:hypothetical protein
VASVVRAQILFLAKPRDIPLSSTTRFRLMPVGVGIGIGVAIAFGFRPRHLVPGKKNDHDCDSDCDPDADPDPENQLPVHSRQAQLAKKTC